MANIDSSVGQTATQATAALSGLSTPWDDVDSAFFDSVTISADRWQGLFPYRLLVIDLKEGNAIVNGSTSSGAVITGSTSQAILSFTKMSSQWLFTLPISPTQLSIVDQYSINTTATLRGIVEEHSGVRFKMINCQGTMGVWPFRDSVVESPSSPNFVQSVFGGTIQSANNVASQLTRAINTATTDHPASKPIRKGPENTDEGLTSTGYYHAMALQSFLEQYAEAKKIPANAGWRLVFDMPKQNQAFVVTPMQFTWQQNAKSAMEINFNFQLKAWRRIDLKQDFVIEDDGVSALSPGIMQRILNTFTEARRVMSASIDLIGAVRSDVDKPFDILRQTSLFVKDLIGVNLAAADLPFQLQKDYASTISTSVSIYKDSIKSRSTDSKVHIIANDLAASTLGAESLTLEARKQGQLGLQAADSQSIDPAFNVFKKPEANFDLMNLVPLNSLKLNPAQQTQVDAVNTATRQITVDDLKKFRATIQELSLQLSNNFGAGATYYSQVYGQPAPKKRIQPMTLGEFDILRKLYDVMDSYDLLTATTQIDDNKKKNNMQYVAGLADLSGIAFNSSQSKILVPVPFGLTMEQIAARYLGSPQRWLEIATLNNLRDPYIDENGFQLPLLSNATGRQITVSSVNNLYVGQRIIIRSATQTPNARRTLGIDRLSDTSYLITVDGAPDLDAYVTADLAYLQAYLPGTVNSQQKIFIPSNIPTPKGPNIAVPSSTLSDPLVGMSKVDWLLTETGDVAVNSYGDVRLAAGITNIIQALKLKIGTRKGSILTHPAFGLDLRVGMSTSDADVQSIYDSINKLIQQDKRFQALETLEVQVDGPKLSINMSVSLANRQGVFPLSFSFVP